ncbi:MAG: HAMP domain-containing protein, partial [Victivallaceae bacterium]|nr:HAMP domain-containing protein [Victivallaceae bacterium]
MRIQTKLTGFFVIALAAFSYALIWISTQAYQEEVGRLNAEVSKARLQEMYKIVNKEYELFLDGAYKDIGKAKRITLKRLESTFRYSSDGGYSFPLVIASNRHIRMKPRSYPRSHFPWNSISLSNIFAPEEQIQEESVLEAEPSEEPKSKKSKFKVQATYSNISGYERIILYVPFKKQNWNWLLCYSYPVNAQLYGVDTKWYSHQLFALVCCMVASAAALFWLIQVSLSPLNRLVLSATEMAAGIFQKHDKKQKFPNDEIGFLSKAFDKMASRIQESMNKLQLEIKERREKER